MARPALEAAEELAGMFDPSEFGVSATFTDPADGSSFSLDVIFDREHFEVDVQAEAGVSSSQPQLQGPTSNLAAVKRGFEVLVGGKSYRVWDRQDDGTGVTVLLLHEDEP